jgi:hypothetical protein
VSCCDVRDPAIDSYGGNGTLAEGTPVSRRLVMVASRLFRPWYGVRFIQLAALLGLCGCLFGKKAPATDPMLADVELQIVNHNYLDVTIYVIHDGQRSRVGVARGSANTAMVLSSRLLGAGRELRLYGDPIGSPEQAITENLVVQPGQYIEWLLETELGRSTVAVY